MQPVSYENQIKQAAQAFVSKAQKLGISISGFSASNNAAGCSVYFKGSDSQGRVFDFRFSDHDCQRAAGCYEKISPTSGDAWLFEYEKAAFPERFNWEFFDKWIVRPDGSEVQVKRLIGRK